MQSCSNRCLSGTPIGSPCSASIRARWTQALCHRSRLHPLLGRTHGDEKSGAKDAVLSNELWKRRFNASSDALGKTIHMSGAQSVIVGVMPSVPRDISIEWGDVWTPMHFYNMRANRASSYRARYLRVLGRIKPGVSLRQAREQMTVLQERLVRETTSVAAGYAVRVESLENALVGRFRPALLTLLGAVGFVLLIACADVANLMLARGVAREKEIAVLRSGPTGYASQGKCCSKAASMRCSEAFPVSRWRTRVCGF
jgi:putative ABC transport system permease protein